MQKKFFILIVVIVLILLVAGLIYMDNIKVKVQEVQEDGLKQTLQNVFEGGPREGIANPRLQIVNGSGDEVAAIDHNGTIVSINMEVDECLIFGSGGKICSGT